MKAASREEFIVFTAYKVAAYVSNRVQGYKLKV